VIDPDNIENAEINRKTTSRLRKILQTNQDDPKRKTTDKTKLETASETMQGPQHVEDVKSVIKSWGQLENFLITRDRPVGNKATSTKCNKCNVFHFCVLSEILKEKRSFWLSCQFNAKLGAIDQLTLGNRRVGHPWSIVHPCAR